MLKIAIHQQFYHYYCFQELRKKESGTFHRSKQVSHSFSHSVDMSTHDADWIMKSWWYLWPTNGIFIWFNEKPNIVLGYNCEQNEFPASVWSLHCVYDVHVCTHGCGGTRVKQMTMWYIKECYILQRTQPVQSEWLSLILYQWSEKASLITFEPNPREGLSL